MIIVTRKRRKRPADPENDPTSAAVPEEKAQSVDEQHRHQDGEHRHHQDGEHHRRHYRDYGTVSLGDLPDTVSEDGQRLSPAAEAAARQAEERQQNLEKYAPILNRKYQNRKHTRLIVAILLAVALFAAALLIVYQKIRDTDQEETIETLEPLDIIDLEDLDKDN